MKAVLFGVGVVALLELANIGMAQNASINLSHPTTTANVIDNAAQEIGTIKVTEAPEGVLLNIDLENLPAGKHGFHIHRVGTCADNEEFKDSGGHIGKDDSQHGLLNPEGHEDGDLPNLIVSEDGRAEAELFVTDLQLRGQLSPNDDSILLDADGSAFIIHENPDDHMTQPIGGAGERIACGALQGNRETL